MKLASLKSGRDGILVVVNARMTRCVQVIDIAPTLQYALDHWADTYPLLQKRADELESGALADAENFSPEKCSSPLPRAYHIADGSAYLHHVELVRQARGATMPPAFLHDPLMYQAVSDTTLGPRDPIAGLDPDFGIDFEGEVAVIVDDVPRGIDPVAATGHIKLVMLMNDISLRHLIPLELEKGFGFFQSKPPSAFSPVAVTPDSLGAYWHDGQLHRPLLVKLNDQSIGRPNAGIDMQFNFGQLIAHAAKTRPLSAGTIIGSGTISNRDPNSGVSCLAEIRMIEKIRTRSISTPFMQRGDTVTLDMHDDQGQSIFGSIQQRVS